MILLSVIIPYYNVSAYIERCARSLMEQTQQEGLEFIFVDDGSTDGSDRILMQTLACYPARQTQVRMIAQPRHQGVGSARHRGMMEASGLYLIHCDADDWLEPNAYQLFCERISDTQADVIVCPFVHEFAGSQYVETYRTLPVADCLSDTRWWSLCTHAVRHTLIWQYGLYPLEEITFWEDMDLLLRVFVHAQTVSYLSVPLYHYDRTHEQSTLHLHKAKVGLDQCQQVIAHLTAYFQDYAPQHLPTLDLLRRSARDLFLEGDSPDLQTWSHCYPEVWPLVWNNRQLSFPYRLCYRLGSHHITWPMRLLLFIARKIC